MKKGLLLVFTLFMSIVGYAYDIAVNYADGVTIYYNYYNNGTELEVVKALYSGKVNIPEEVTYMGRTRKVTNIGNEAFQNCRGLTSVTIPNSVTSIGNSAFQNCSGLTSVTIPNSVTSIGDSAFSGCSGLTSVTIVNSVTSIGGSAFSVCSGLTSVVIPNSVITIGYKAFYGCSGLTSVTIGNSVTSIGDNAFEDCSSLTSVHITDIEAWCKISFSSNPLYYAHHLYLNGEEIKDLVIPNSVTSIGNYAFNGCSGLTSVSIPNSVTSIGNCAFSVCSGLTSVVIPNSVITIGYKAFYGCRGLTSVTIPNSVTRIGERAFSYCDGLTSISIPNSVTDPHSVYRIGKYAFSYCSGLTSVTIGNAWCVLGSRAFFGCTGLTSVISKMEYPGSIDDECFPYDVFYNATLYVPKGTTDKYKSTNYWSKFVFIEEGEPGSSVIPDPKICATPTINYSNKELTFSCTTEGVKYVSRITDADIKSFNSNKISLTATYEISVYATKSGYENSNMATATLVWTEAIFTETTPDTPTSAKAVTESIPVLISANNGNITVKSEANGQAVAVYSVDGQLLGNATVSNGQATVSTTLQNGNVAVVKVGNKSVKVLMQ